MLMYPHSGVTTKWYIGYEYFKITRRTKLEYNFTLDGEWLIDILQFNRNALYVPRARWLYDKVDVDKTEFAQFHLMHRQRT